MINFKHHIIELLKSKNAVNLPNFGCFIAIDLPSIKKDNSIQPPSRKVIFKADYKDEEDFLANYIVSKEKISFSVAIYEIQKEINLIKEFVLEKNNYLFDELGSFFLNKNGDIEFKFNDQFNLNLNSYGLKSI